MSKYLATILLLFSFNAMSNNWGLCPGTPVTGMVPCDTSCFGPAGTRLGTNYVEVETTLQNAFLENANYWVSTNNAYVEYLSSFLKQSNISSTERVRAYDGVAKMMTASIERFSKTKERTTDHFISSYQQIHKDLRTQEVVIDNAKNYSNSNGSFTGNYLLKRIDEHADFRTAQSKLTAIVDILEDKRSNIDSGQQAMLLGVSEQKSDDELTVQDFAQLIVDAELNNEQYEAALKGMITLYETRKVTENHHELRQQLLNDVALNTLSSSLVIHNDNEYNPLLSSEHIRNMHFDAYTSGEYATSLKHALNQEYATLVSVQNALLNDYLKQKRALNAVKTLNHF